MYYSLQIIQGSLHQQVTKWHHSINFQNMQNAQYTFCREFYPELERPHLRPAVDNAVIFHAWLPVDNALCATPAAVLSQCTPTLTTATRHQPVLLRPPIAARSTNYCHRQTHRQTDNLVPLTIVDTRCDYHDDDQCDVVYKSKYGNVAVANICKEQCSVIHFPQAKGLNINAIHFEMHPVSGDLKHYTRPATHVLM